MTQKLLHGADVITRHQQVGRKAVPQGMGPHALHDTRLARGLIHGFLQGILM
jgi:hypothetical protein